MPTPHERHRNNVKAGIFVSVTVILALVVLAILKDVTTWFGDRNTFAMTFSVEAGVQALTEGSQVRVGGIPMGSVIDIELLDLVEGEGMTEEHLFDTIVVVFELDDRVPLRKDAFAFIRGPLIGSDAWVEISNIGQGERLVPDRIRDPSNWLQGRDTGTVLAALLGPQGAEKTGAILDDVAEFTPFLRNIQSEYDSRVVPILEDTAEAARELRELMVRIGDEDWPRWVATVDEVMSHVLAASETLDLAMDDGRRLIASAQEGVDDVNAMIDRNRPAVDQTIDNIALASDDVRALADRLATQTIDKVEAILDRGQEGIDSFARVGEKVELEFDLLAPPLRDAMASLQIAANELALGTTELRSSPWRLLYRPDKDELEYENLYFAATKFALAASELKAATQSMERAIAHHREFLDRNPERLEQLQQEMVESYRRYEAAQRDFLDILKGSEP